MQAYNMGDDDTGYDFSSSGWLQSLTSIAQTALSLDQQRNLDQINATRAAQGLMPINTAAYASGVSSGYTPMEISPLMLMVGIVALVAILK